MANNEWGKLNTYVPRNRNNRSYTDENGQTWEYNSSYPGTPAPNSRNPAADQQARDARYRSQLGWDTARKYPMPSGTNQWRGQDVSGGYQGISANRDLRQTPYQAALAQADDQELIIRYMADRERQQNELNAARQQWEAKPSYGGYDIPQQRVYTGGGATGGYVNNNTQDYRQWRDRMAQQQQQQNALDEYNRRYGTNVQPQVQRSVNQYGTTQRPNTLLNRNMGTPQMSRLPNYNVGQPQYSQYSTKKRSR